MRVEELIAVRLERADSLDRRQRKRRLPSVDHDPAAFAVDGRDHARSADRAGERARERDVRRVFCEQRRARDDLVGTRGEHVCRARHAADAAADAAAQRPGDLPHEREVVAGAHRRVEIDDLDFWKPLEPPHPLLHVVVFDREPLALHELHDGAVLEID